MAAPVIPLVFLGLAAAGFAVASQPAPKKPKRKKSSPSKGIDPSKPKVVFGLNPETQRFGVGDLSPFRVGDVVTFMVGQLDHPDPNTERLGRLYRPEAADLGHKGLEDYRIVDIENWDSEMAGSQPMQAVWRLARIGQNPIAPYSWTFYKFASYATAPDEINYVKGGSPSIAAVRVQRDGQVIWESKTVDDRIV